MPKIVHLSSVHRAQDTRILHRECRSLVEAGYDVTLIANAERDFEEHGVRVRALPPNTGGRLGRMTRQVARVFRMARQEKADLYHFHDPELIPIGLLLRLGGTPVIYDVHESVSRQILSKPWIPKPLRVVAASLYRLMERGIAPFISAFVAATPGVASFVPERKTTVVQNFPGLSELQEGLSTESTQREPLAVYVGSMSAARGAHELVAAMSKMPADSPVQLVLGGPIPSEQLRTELETAPGSERVTLPGELKRKEVSELLARASVGLCVLHPEPNYIDSYPTKLFEYMAVGLPVIASDFPFWKQFVEDIGSGLMVDPMDPQAIADGILEIINDPERARKMGEAGASAVRERFNWENEARKLVELVESLIGKP